MLISCHLCKKIETIPKTSFLAVFLALLGAYLLDGRMFILLRRLRVRNRAFFWSITIIHELYLHQTYTSLRLLTGESNHQREVWFDCHHDAVS